MHNDISFDNHYHGIPLSEEHGPYVEQRLADALATVEGIMNESHRVISSCIELKVPEEMTHCVCLEPDNSVQEFVKKLQHNARWKHTELHKRNPNRRKPVIDAIWQKGCTAQGKR